MRHINYLSFPQLPSALEQEILDIAEQASTFHDNDTHVNASDELLAVIGEIAHDPNTNLGYHHSQAKEYFPTRVNYHFLEASDNIKNWIAEHINPKFNVHIQVISNGALIPPHIDEVRSHAINYLIETGGNAITSFYSVKPEFKHLTISPQTSIPYEKLQVTDSVLLAPHQWHSLKVTEIHGVTNIDPGKRRVALTISVI